MTRVAVLGSTGSIGTQALEVAHHLSERIRIVALAGGHNSALLSEQMRIFRPHLYSSLAPARTSDYGARSATLTEIASDEEVDTVLVATSGSAGIEPTVAALRHGKVVALANKEVLVMAGKLVTETARRYGGRLVPVDSEHSAVFQCLRGEEGPISRLLLTASGGPFYRCSADRLARVTTEEALAHPVWSMGRKVTIDSATLMNKGLEVIEARWLFDVPLDRINVVVHPQCLVHSMVEFCDGVVKAQLSQPDMRLPIQYALTYPDRLPTTNPGISWSTILSLTFEPVDTAKFPCLELARQAALKGLTFPAALCGADETAISLFLQGQITFNRIAEVVALALANHRPGNPDSIDELREAEEDAHRFVLAQCSKTGVEDAARPHARL